MNATTSSSPASAASSGDAAGSPEILLAILTDLSIDHRCHKLATALRDAGYRPVICCDKPLHPLGAAWDGFDIRVLTRRSHLEGFLPAFATWMLRLLPFLWRTRAKVWISLDAPPLLWLAFWGKLRGRTVVYDSHELFLETMMVRGRRSRRLFWTAWENAGFALIRRCITVSPSILERLRARHPKVEFYLLPNMPIRETARGDATRKPPLGAEDPVKVIYQGGLRASSGLPELFRALASRPRFEVDIYGGGPEDGALRVAARDAGIADRVRFHGSIPFDQLPAKMEAAHLGINLVQPVCGSFALTWANKIFDYAHTLTPVLLSENPAHALLLERHAVGVMADSFSPDAVGAALDALVENHAAHVEACRRAREEWHWEAYARGTRAFLES